MTKSCDATTMNEMEVYQKNKGRLTRNNQLLSSTFDKIDKNILSNEMNKTIKKKVILFYKWMKNIFYNNEITNENSEIIQTCEMIYLDRLRQS